MIDIKNRYTEAHLNAKEYLSFFKSLLPIMPHEYDLKKFEELVKFFYESIIPHFDEEEEFLQELFETHPSRKTIKVILKIQKEHLEILAMFETFVEKIKTIEDSKAEEIDLTHLCISVIDAVLKHADYEDRNLAPLFK